MNYMMGLNVIFDYSLSWLFLFYDYHDFNLILVIKRMHDGL